MIIQGYLPTGKVLPIAAAVFSEWKDGVYTVAAETSDNTEWVWDQLKQTILGEWLDAKNGPITIMSDRGAAILKGVQLALPHSDIAFCATHLFANVNAHCRSNKSPQLQGSKSGKDQPNTAGLFWKAVAAWTKQEFDNHMSQLREHNRVAWEYLDQIEPRHWARYAQCQYSSTASSVKLDSYVRSTRTVG
mmetsp:Transcript_9280/g.31009  ORF Transcript_9280/g.31009 Transcript_9280/m.31009 type:complete len:190 (+) Transcript_9280:1207-1776(+)